MSSYEALAGSYDALTGDVQYEKRADYLVRLMHRSAASVHSVLDLACGTGTMSCLLAQRGYEVVGVDLSEEMLALAANKALALPAARRPFFLQQSMTALTLGGTVDAALCCLDSLNYLTEKRAVQRTFRRVWRCLNPGGVFIFDVNTPYKLEGLDGQVFLDETEDSFCVWRADYTRRSRSITYGMDLFQRQKNGAWRRSREEHRERAYTEAELRQWLTEAGFTAIRVYGELSRRAPKETEQRIYISAVKAKE